MEQAQHSLSQLLSHLKSGKAKGLDVIFERLGEKGSYQLARQRYPLRVTDPLQPTYPGEVDQLSALTTFLEKQLPEARTPDACINLLEACGGFVAAVDDAGKEVGGVSWFDQVRLRLALEACGERVLVVRTDISGIQDFIYGTASEKALKSLRARSFYLELLAVHTLRELLRQTGMTRANVAYIGGGGYQLYLPASQRAKVEHYAREFDDWLWAEHQGTLGFSFALKEISRAEVESGGEFQRELSASLSTQKARRRSGNLVDVFGEPQDPAPRLEREKHLNEQFAAFGGQLPSASHIEVACKDDVKEDGWITLQDMAYRPYRAAAHKPLPPERLALNRLDDFEAFPMLTGNYVTRVQDIPEPLRIEDGEQASGPKSVATHEQLTQLSLGQPRLALFRCDADSMGSYFSGGIPGHTAARHATLSRLMSLFFQGYVNTICARREPLLPEVPQAERSHSAQHGRYLNIIYSGGDDAAVVGAWNEVLTFAVDLRQAYKQFTGGNPELGLSGGAFIAKAKYPLRRMAERAEEAEKLAKQAKEGGKVVKDGFVPFLTMDTPSDDPRAAVRWNVFAALEDGGAERTLDILQDFLKLKDVSQKDGIELEVKRAFLWKLQAFAEREGDAWRLPLLHYALARATPPERRQQEWKALQSKLLLPSTWPHLGHVLGFLHLARPLSEDRQSLSPDLQHKEDI
ncbi:type III-A CRISPR-associated protein Cas10/Csm1 (plasmid) [Deinococcus sp. VB343]|uniref:type III-A CRISPR-associated protein Cas10/Csm1 n=1 Tax=unclassified Deinococcus TaxID=2623546 RepID=UPI0039C9EB17